MSKKSHMIPIETSARHIHLSEDDFNVLFGDKASLTFVKELSQPGQFLAAERLNVVGPNGTFEGMAVLGPFRKETQVEVSMTDCRTLGVESVIRQSGYTKNTPGCKLVGPCGEVVLDHGVIVAKRHIHMSPSDAIRLNVKDNDEVFVLTKSFGRGVIFADVVVRVDRNFRLAMHVDTDEANSFASGEEPFGVIVKLFDDSSFQIDEWINDVLDGINR